MMGRERSGGGKAQNERKEDGKEKKLRRSRTGTGLSLGSAEPTTMGAPVQPKPRHCAHCGAQRFRNKYRPQCVIPLDQARSLGIG